MFPRVLPYLEEPQPMCSAICLSIGPEVFQADLVRVPNASHRQKKENRKTRRVFEMPNCAKQIWSATNTRV